MSCLCFRGDVERLLIHMCDNNRYVESVAITRCPMPEAIYGFEWGLLNAWCLNRLILSCPKIRSLKFNEIHICGDILYDNLGMLRKLTCLHLSHSTTLTPKQIKIIANKCCNLAQLWLSGEDHSCYEEDWEDAYCTLFQQRWRTLIHLQFDASKLRDETFKVLKYMYVCVIVCV